MADIYKKLKQSHKKLKRSVDVTNDEKTTINNINLSFIEYFKAKHLS
jgi:hypothetical protein